MCDGGSPGGKPSSSAPSCASMRENRVDEDGNDDNDDGGAIGNEKVSMPRVFRGVAPFIPLMILTLVMSVQCKILSQYLLNSLFSERYTPDGQPLPCSEEQYAKMDPCKRASRDTSGYLGLITTISAVFGFLTSAVCGELSDRIGRKRVLFWITLLSSVPFVAIIIFALHPRSSAAAGIYLITLSIFGGIQEALTAVNFAAVADRVHGKAERSPAFGLLLATVLGGGLLALPFLKYPEKPLLIAFSSVRLIAPLYVLLVLPSDKPTCRETSEKRVSLCSLVKGPIASFRILRRSKLFFRLMWVVAINGFAVQGTQTLLVPYQNTVLGFGKADLHDAMLAVFASALVSLLIFLPILTSFFGERISLIVGIFFTCIGSVLLSFLHLNKSALLLSVAMYYGPGLMILPSVSAIKANNVRDDEQGAVQGAIVGVSTFAEGCSPVLYGYAFKFFSDKSSSHYQPQAPFMSSFALAILASMVAISLPRYSSRRDSFFAAKEPLLPVVGDEAALTGAA